MTSWQVLQETLDAVAARGESIRLWWRDDDAGRNDPALERLLSLAETRGAPLALAVVPLWLQDDAAARIAASSQACVLQHGFAHDDHARPGEKSIELGGRDAERIGHELREGRARLLDAFGAVFVAVQAPPWNRIDEAVTRRLAAWGFVGLSTFGPRPAAPATPGLACINAHLDPVDWRGTRLFVGEAVALEQLVEAVALPEPIGILSHHLALDAAGWAFLDRLLEFGVGHPGVRFCALPELLEDGA